MSADFAAVLAAHRARYPRMQPQDYAKLAYQAACGPAHLLASGEDEVQARLAAEWQAVPPDAAPPDKEPVGGGLVRFPLRAGQGTPEAVRLLARLLKLTAQEHRPDPAALDALLGQVDALPVEGLTDWLAAYRSQGCPAVGHSDAYRAAYRPHYRLLRYDYAYYFPLLLGLAQLAASDAPAVLAIDGCCGSGKTRLAALLQAVFPCRVFHTDDFYLPIARRAADWQAVPAGNMDLERLRREVLEPARAGGTVTLRAFDCRSQSLRPAQAVPDAPLTIVEGSYALHPSLTALYDRMVFLTCPEDEQTRRLRAREGAHYADFEAVWMPLERQYHRLCGVPKDAVQFDTGGLLMPPPGFLPCE